MVEVYKKRNSIRQKPLNLKDIDLPLFSRELEKEIHATNLVVVKDAYIIRDTVLDLGKFKIYEDYTQAQKRGQIRVLSRLLSLANEKKYIEKAVWIIDNWSNNYFHWLTDALTRYIAADDFISDHLILLPNEYKNLPFVTESIELLDIPVHYFDPKTCIKIGELVLPGHTAPTGNYNKEIINQLRDKFVFGQVTPFRKVFISRQKATKRTIVNEIEVQSLVKEFGYEIQYFEELDFRQQIKIMTEAKSLIGLHGAGLTNMLFMNKGAQVLEFRNKDDAHNNCYFSLASDLGLDYYYQLCNSNSADTHAAAITVDLVELRKNLELMSA